MLSSKSDLKTQKRRNSATLRLIYSKTQRQKDLITRKQMTGRLKFEVRATKRLKD